MYQLSLIAAYIAGMVALFAPCCMSYLFPAYIGNVFREKRFVILMTLVYSLGIFAVMMPIVLGARALASVFMQLHDYTYIVGGVFMVFVGILSFIGIKLPMPHFSRSTDGRKTDMTSTFMLGIFSGITSACCAPVLIGVMTLSALTPSLILSMGIGAAYVLGMVTPLYVAAVFIDKGNIMDKPILKRRVMNLTIAGHMYPVFVSNIVASIIFIITGVGMILLAGAGKLGMTVAQSAMTKTIHGVALRVTDITGQNPVFDILFVLAGVFILYRFIKQGMRGPSSDERHTDHACCHTETPDPTAKTMSEHTDHEHHMHVHDDHGHDHHRQGHSGHNHGSHEHHMASPQAAADFLRRFWIVTVLLLPLILMNPAVLGVLGYADFGLRPYIQFGIASVIFYFALVFFEHARHEIMARQYGMMTLVSMAVGAGYVFSAVSTFLPQLDAEFYLEISTLIWILLFGHYLEARSSTAAGDALDEVSKLLPQTAHKVIGKQTKDVDVSTLVEGDTVLVKPGEKVPADGVITVGNATFNEAHISGESKPVLRKKGSAVVAGSICLDAAIRVRLTRVGEHSTIGQIKQLIATAKYTKPRAQRIADRAARILTFAALGVALLALVGWTVFAGQPFVFAVTIAITVLVISCPHALGLAIPTVTTIATQLAVKNGLFIKDMGKLEIVRGVDYVVFDKTGTLTRGEFGVTDVVSLTRNQDDIVRIAASLETHSTHVIGVAIVEYAKKKRIKFSDVSEVKDVAGKGISGAIRKRQYYAGSLAFMKNKNVWSREAAEQFGDVSALGKTVVFVADEKNVIGMIALADRVRFEAEDAIHRLHRLGVKTAMLTGDNEAVAKAVAGRLKIDRYFAHVLPKGKYTHIQKLQEEGNTVLMVGDGVNDAPALTQADVGVAIGAGTDVAVEAGDIVLTRNNPEDIANLIVLSREVYRKMRQNLWWALGYNIVAIPAAAGLFVPWGFVMRPEMGAILMSVSSVIVVANAMSLRKISLTG